jgi:hypothetical protein
MSADSPSVFPPNRVLAQWWTQIAFLHPKQIWIGCLLLHCVEALVSVTKRVPLDGVPLFVLRALALGRDRTLDEIDLQLRLGPSLLAQILNELSGQGLVERTGTAVWTLSPIGARVAASGNYEHSGQERRVFHFRECEAPPNHPRFINLRLPPIATIPWPTDRTCHFEPSVLQDCVQQTDEWKRAHDFPTDVTEVITGRSVPGLRAESRAWNRIVLDQPRCLTGVVVLVLNPSGGEQILALPYTVETWALDAREPALVLRAPWHETLPDLRQTLPAEEWRQAWRTWCQTQHLSPADADQCELTPRGCALRVAAPKRLIDRFGAERGGLLRGERWLMAGGGKLRNAFRVELEEARRRKGGRSTS